LRPKAIISRIGLSSSTISTCLAGIICECYLAPLLQGRNIAES
jgi:hypothetical protein